MSEFEERKKFWRIFYSPLVLIVLLVVFLFIARSMLRVYSHEQVSTEDRQRVEDELATVSRRAAALKDQVDALSTQQGIDNEIRSKFNVSKAGEGVAIIVNGTSAESFSATNTPVTRESWWQKLVGSFGL